MLTVAKLTVRPPREAGGGGEGGEGVARTKSIR